MQPCLFSDRSVIRTSYRAGPSTLTKNEIERAAGMKRRWKSKGCEGPVIKSYATVSDDEDCATFREIADTMTLNGDKMNHASARNYVLRVMRKFAIALADRNDVTLDDVDVEFQATHPEFQSAIGRLVQDYYASGANIAPE